MSAPPAFRTIDYLISDPRQTPEGVDAHYVERIVRLRDCYVCYEPPAYAPPVGPLPALSTGCVTYGCFNNLAKIDEASIALWSTLLRDRGDRRLLLRTFALDVPRVRDRIIARFEAHGVRPDQLILSPASPHRDLLDSYNAVDIALDPLAYSGGLTTLEALWMGVPVITLPGDRFCTRHSLAHLTAAGLTGLVAEDASGYLARAEGLAADLERLAACGRGCGSAWPLRRCATRTVSRGRWNRLIAGCGGTGAPPHHRALNHNWLTVVA